MAYNYLKSRYGHTSFDDRLRVNTWMDDEEVPAGALQANVTYLRQLHEIHNDMADNAIILYFLLTDLGVTSVRQMFTSATSQLQFMRALRYCLKEKMVTKKYEHAFEEDFKKMRNRVDHIRRITRENLYLTEYYPFFLEVGFETLHNFEKGWGTKNVDNQLKPVKEAALKYNQEHPDVIAAHMAEIQPKLDALEDMRQKNAERGKAERAAYKARKKAENAEVKEIRENNRKYKADMRKREKSFEHYYS